MISDKTYPFTLPPLPYAYDALEPYIDMETMYFHHDKHMKTYVDNLNKGLKDYPQYHNWTLEHLIAHLFLLPKSLQKTVRDNGGGVYNHDLYFDLMTPDSAAQTRSQTINSSVIDSFGGIEQWKKEMKDAGLGQFGSGFAWLVLNPSGNSDSSPDFGTFRIISLPNQDNPLSIGLYPILPLDVWEHAYYLKHQNLRGDYIDDWFHVINWKGVENRIKQLSKQTSTE